MHQLDRLQGIRHEAADVNCVPTDTVKLREHMIKIAMAAHQLSCFVFSGHGGLGDVGGVFALTTSCSCTYSTTYCISPHVSTVSPRWKNRDNIGSGRTDRCITDHGFS